MSAPPLSILLAVRNEECFLPAALNSLYRQSYCDWELVAVDDGSGDATPAILTEAARRDSRVRLLPLPPVGLVAALNQGLQACRAPLVARMDGDDICHPHRLEHQLALLRQRPELSLVACGIRHFPRSRVTDGLRAYAEWQNGLLEHQDILRDLYVESPFAHPAVMFRRDPVLAVGGYRDLGWAEDYDLWLRLAAAGAHFARVPQPLLFWRDRPERLTRTAPHCSAAAFRACKVHHLARGFLRGVREVTLWGAGLEGKAWRRALEPVGVRVVRWIDIDPRKLGRRIHEAPVEPIAALAPGQGKTLITIGAKGARAQVRAWAAAAKLEEGLDFLCVT